MRRRRKGSRGTTGRTKRSRPTFDIRLWRGRHAGMPRTGTRGDTRIRSQPARWFTSVNANWRHCQELRLNFLLGSRKSVPQPLHEDCNDRAIYRNALRVQRPFGRSQLASLAFSYTLMWPPIFAFAVLPGVVIGLCMRTWQSSVVLTEIFTFVGATMIDHPTLEQLFQTPFAMHLAMAQLARFPPLLLSILIGHHIRSRRSQGPREPYVRAGSKIRRTHVEHNWSAASPEGTHIQPCLEYVP